MNMSEKNLASATAYYQALSNKDLAAVEKHLHPDVQLISPLAVVKGKDAVLNSLKHLLSAFNKLSVRDHFGTGDRVMLAYDIDFPAPIGLSRAAVLLTFKEGLIIRYELFFDARPFEKR